MAYPRVAHVRLPKVAVRLPEAIARPRVSRAGPACLAPRIPVRRPGCRCPVARSSACRGARGCRIPAGGAPLWQDDCRALSRCRALTGRCRALSRQLPRSDRPTAASGSGMPRSGRRNAGMAGSWVRADWPPGGRFLLPAGGFRSPRAALPRRGLLSSGKCARAARPVSPGDRIDPGDVLPVHRRAKRPAIAAPSAAW